MNDLQITALIALVAFVLWRVAYRAGVDDTNDAANLRVKEAQDETAAYKSRFNDVMEADKTRHPSNTGINAVPRTDPSDWMAKVYDFPRRGA